MSSQIQLKSKSEIERMRVANMFVYEVHQELRRIIVPGVTTRELDELALKLTRERGAEPAFLNYPSASQYVGPFPGVICSSVNDEIVHGVPGSRTLVEGDVISVDYGCKIDEFYGDSAHTIAVGKIDPKTQKLLKVTAECLERAIEACQVGNRIGDISFAVQSHAESHQLGVVREFVGHGIGRAMHEPPHVPNIGNKREGRVLRAGMVIAIEPMITLGSPEVRVLDDGWTAVTRDGSWAAHFEHTVAITDSGPLVLSRP